MRLDTHACSRANGGAVALRTRAIVWTAGPAAAPPDENGRVAIRLGVRIENGIRAKPNEILALLGIESALVRKERTAFAQPQKKNTQQSASDC